jgi:hypothetical protein
VRTVVVRRYAFEAVSWDQVCAILSASDVRLIVEPAA